MRHILPLGYRKWINSIYRIPRSIGCGLRSYDHLNVILLKSISHNGYTCKISPWVYISFSFFLLFYFIRKKKKRIDYHDFTVYYLKKFFTLLTEELFFYLYVYIISSYQLTLRVIVIKYEGKKYIKINLLKTLVSIVRLRVSESVSTIILPESQ